MKATLYLAAMLLGATGIVQVMPDADRLAQRRRPVRIGPRRAGPAPVPPQPVSVGQTGDNPRGGGGGGDNNEGRRCIAACDRTMGDCMHRCPQLDERPCIRTCLTTNAQCLQRCPREAVEAMVDGGEWRPDPGAPVLRNVGR